MNRRSRHWCDTLPQQTVRRLRGITPGELSDWARATGQAVIDANFKDSTDKASVMQEIARAFKFPTWFGLNLDALYDALTDLPDRAPAPGYVVLLEHLSRTGQPDNGERAAVLAVFRDAARDFAARGIPFRVLYSVD